MSHETTQFELDVEWCRRTFIYADSVADHFEDEVADYIADEVFEGSTVEQARDAARFYFTDATHRLVEDFKRGE